MKTFVNGPLVVVVSRTRSVLRAVEALLGINLLGVGWVVGGLLLRVDWHQILQVELLFLLALASKADGGSGQKNGGDELAGDGGPCDDVRPVVGDSGVVPQDLKRTSTGFGKRPISVQLRLTFGHCWKYSSPTTFSFSKNSTVCHNPIAPLASRQAVNIKIAVAVMAPADRRQHPAINAQLATAAGSHAA